MKTDSLQNAMNSAMKRKQALFEETEALRLLNAEASNTPRLVFELYGKHGVLYDYGTGDESELRKTAGKWLVEFGWESITLLDRSFAGNDERKDSAVVAGTAPETLVVREGPLQFRVEPQHPRNVGLFLDTRELRRWLRESSNGAKVLNLFSYTCSLGLAALSGGAEEVVNVDVSQRYLDWGRENLKLNGLSEDKCRFKNMDSERYLDWAAKKKLSFDRIILDPPVFSRFDGKVFRFESDYFRLTAKCSSLLSPNGTLYAVTNYAGIGAEDFKQGLREAVVNAGKTAREIQRISLPEDCDIAPGSGMRAEGNAIMFQIRTN